MTIFLLIFIKGLIKIMENYIKRDVELAIKKALEAGYIVAILGARQTGKTTLMQKIKEDYLQQGYSSSRIFVFNFDDVLLRNRVATDFYYLVNSMEKTLGTSIQSLKEPVLLCIDEAQKVPAIFELLKIIHDKQKKMLKILITGSSSLDIQQKSAESLAGRIQYYYLYPLSLSEILKDRFKFSGKRTLFWQLSNNQLNYQELRKQQGLVFTGWERIRELEILLERIMLDGGLPAVWQRPAEKDRVYKSMVETYLEKDIRSLREVGSLNDFTQLLRISALEVGSMVNMSKLSHAAGIALNTLKKYHSILVSSFVVNKLQPLVSARKKLVKSPKLYFFDVGIANYLARRDVFEHLQASKIEGAVFENVLLKSWESYNNNLLRPSSLAFWRDYQGHEIDFVLESGQERIPVEVTLADKLDRSKKINLKHFFDNYPQTRFGMVVYTGELKTTNALRKRIYLIPWWMWW